MELIEEFKEEITDYANRLLSQLDSKIAQIDEKRLLDYQEECFKFQKRLERVEENLYGYNLSTDDNGR